MRTLMLLMLVVAFSSTQAVDLRADFILEGGASQHNPDSLFQVPDTEFDLNTILDLNLVHGPATLIVRGEEDLTRWQVLQAYVEYSFAGLEWILGRRYLGWDVAYGQKPLDLFGEDDERGADLVAAEYFTDFGSFSLVCTPATTGSHELVGENALCALRSYQLIGDIELQGTLYWPETGWGAGGGFSWVPLDWLELHGSGVLQSKYQRRQMLADGSFYTLTRHHGALITLGSNLTLFSQLQTVIEWQYNAAAYDKEQWRAILALARQRERSALDSGWSETDARNWRLELAEAYRQPTLSRGSWLMHSFWDWGDWTPELTVLYLPFDQSIMLQPELDWSVTSRLSSTLSYTYFFGDDSSVYGHIPSDQQWQMSFIYTLSN